jgi:hypothetical protein
VATDWDEAIQQVAELLAGAGGEVVVLASPRTSTEALFLARAIAGDGFRGAFRVERLPEEHPLPGVPGLALRGERAPNVKAAVTLGYAERFTEQIARLGKAAVVVILDEHLDGVAADALAGVPHLIHVGTMLPAAARDGAAGLVGARGGPGGAGAG